MINPSKFIFRFRKPLTTTTQSGNKLWIGYDTELLLAINYNFLRFSFIINGYGVSLLIRLGKQNPDALMTEFPIFLGFSLFRRQTWLYLFNKIKFEKRFKRKTLSRPER